MDEMTPDDAFIDAIIAEPDADAPRLLYADYLEEHGEPERAEFIRVQCELARTLAGDPRREALEARERKLPCWISGRMVDLCTDVWFCRGFIEAVQFITDEFAGSPRTLTRNRRTIHTNGFDSAAFLARLDKVCGLAPVRGVHLTPSDYLHGTPINLDLDSVQALVESDLLARMSLFNLQYNDIEEDARQLLLAHFRDRVQL